VTLMGNLTIRLKDIGGEPDAVELFVTALTELPIAEALVMIHGRTAGLRRYREVGGRVWFDDDGEPIIWRRSP
jgi:hypothetical protein